MAPSAPQPARRLAPLGSLAASLIVLAALCAALWTPANLDLSTVRGSAGQRVVTWVAPDGPAWNAGVRPGSFVVGMGALGGGAPAGLVVRTGRRRLVVSAASLAVTPLDVLVAVLGLGLVVLGTLVLVKSEEQAAGEAFWRLSLLAGTTMGVVPAGFHGVPWALALTFGTLYAVGPALWELTGTFPRTERETPHRGTGRRALVWLPIFVLLMLYPLCWRQPIPLFPLLLLAGNAVLAGGLLAACIRIIGVLRQPLGAHQRAQLAYLALGVVCGFGPFVILTLVPLLLMGWPLIPADISILALVLLPLSIGVAIVRTEFLGITSLLHRRTLRIVLGLGTLAGLAAATAALVANAPRHWPGSPVVVAVGASVLAAVGFTPLLRWLTRQGERLLFRDSYDMGGTLLRLSVELFQARSEELGRLVVERLAAVLDLSFVLLLAEDQQWWYRHPRSTILDSLQASILRHAHARRAQPATAEVRIERIQRLPVLVLPLAADHWASGVLCLGPKRSGDRYTRQDWALLGALGRQLAVMFANYRLRAELDEQITALRQVVAERSALSAQLQVAEQRERRRLAGVLHDEAIQLGEEIIRALSDVLADAPLPGHPRDRLTTAAFLGEELVARLRAVVSELYPPSLETAGLVPALQALLREAEERSGLTCALHADLPMEQHCLPQEAELILYSIAREAVGNALRHAQATTVAVTLRWTGEHLWLSVRDDGQGFPLAATSSVLAAGHLGLALLRDRAQELGGTLAIATAPGQGTTVEVRVPLPATSRAREDVA